jgi:hypothetical protein
VKKLVALLVGAMLLPLGAAPSAHASSYPTDVSMRAPNKATVGEKVRVVVKPQTDGPAEGTCTGDLVLIVKDDARAVVKSARKPVQDRVTFAFKLRKAGLYGIAAKYQRGEDDPCSTSRVGDDLQIGKLKS